METERLQKSGNKKRIDSIYGTFHLDQLEFTLPVEKIQEVVNFPEQIVQVPLAPLFLIGIFNLRGAVIPIINMRALLRLKNTEITSNSKIAIVHLDRVKIGLIFDSTGEILNVNEEQKDQFNYSENSGSNVVKGALKLNEGSRIIQVLEPSALLKIDNLPQIFDQINLGNPRLNHESKIRGTRMQCISFWTGKTKLALDIGSIREIIGVPELQPSVISDENCIGVVNLRGSIIPIVDFVKIFGFREKSPRTGQDERILIMKMGSFKVGLLIDGLDNIVSFYKDEIIPIPLLNQGQIEAFHGLLSKGPSNEIIFLNVEGVLSNPSLKSLVDGYSKSFGRNNDTHESKKKEVGRRRVCIAFQLDRDFALPIQEIQEIINHSESAIKPPGLPKQIRGVLNLRGQAITLVDLRELYGLSSFQDLSQTKILIVERNQSKFGLIVDAVENIVSFFDEQKLDLPIALLNDSQDTLQGDIKEILELANTDDQSRKCLMILDIEKVLSRIERILKVA